MISENDVKFYISANFSNEESDENMMRNALASIAQELIRFQYSTEESNQDESGDHQIFKKIDINAIALKSKNRQLKKLKGNLKTACTVARIAMSAKDREMEYLINHLNLIRNESSILQQTHTQNMNMIEKLKTENFNIYNEVERVRNYIHIGYQELQRLRNQKPNKDLLLIVKLKEILIACGQYYADYCNEHERCIQLEQRNRFLKNKVSILENNLAATTEELRNLRNQNVRLTRSLDSKHLAVEPLANALVNNNNALVNKSQIKLSSHLSAVRHLLHDQDSMLRDLKKLSEELSAPELQ